MGQLIDAAQTAYDNFWNDLKSSDLTTVDMNAAMVQKTTLELRLEQARQKEETFNAAQSAALSVFDEDAKLQLDTKRAELATFESDLSMQRTVIEQNWERKRVDGNYNTAYVSDLLTTK